MDYSKHYNLLINKAKSRSGLEGYKERHHIIPRCMGGTDEPDNLIDLTAREHYLAHLLLLKMYPKNHKLAYAVHLMTSSTKFQIRNNRSYEWVRKKVSEANSNILKGKKRAPRSKEWSLKISNSLKGRNLSDEHKSAIANTLKGVKKSDSMRKNMSKVAKNRTADHNKKLAEANRGKKRTIETIEKLKAVSARQIPITCPHCGKTGKPRGMKFWHFDKCKEKQNGV